MLMSEVRGTVWTWASTVMEEELNKHVDHGSPIGLSWKVLCTGYLISIVWEDNLRLSPWKPHGLRYRIYLYDLLEEWIMVGTNILPITTFYWRTYIHVGMKLVRLQSEANITLHNQQPFGKYLALYILYYYLVDKAKQTIPMFAII